VEHLSRREHEAYVYKMITLVRLARILVILLLATFTLTFVVGVARPETGVIEKIVLLGLVAGCVVLAAKVSPLASRAERRLQRH
jgi:tryptophan-rich sensory protein